MKISKKIGENTLENTLKKALEERTPDKGKMRFLTLRNTVPVLIPDIIFFGFDRKQTASLKLTANEVVNVLMKLGLKMLEMRFGNQIQQLAKLQTLPKTELATELLKANPFRFQHSLFDPRPWEERMLCSQVKSVRDKLGKPLHLPLATAISLILMLGIAQSESIITKAWVDWAQEELNDFNLYLNKQIKSFNQ
jgi:hypothetical protein